MKKKWIILLLVIVSGAFILYKYVNKDHRNILTEKAEFEVSASVISSEFQLEASLAEKKYLNKTIVITGKISNIDVNSLTLDKIVFCDLKKDESTDVLNIGETLSIKGRCIGYDDLLGELKLDQCSILN